MRDDLRRTLRLFACLGVCLVCLGSIPDRLPDDSAAARAEVAVAAVLDDWHRAAAAADQDRYFGHIARDGVFLGTDATERWNRDEFLAFAKPYFAKGKAWSFRATRRSITVSKNGAVAWFDEDLATENLGPCRGSGVLTASRDGWQIAQYNLAVTIPNERFAEVRKLLNAKE